MMNLTSEQLDKFRKEFENCPDALRAVSVEALHAVSVIEAYEGDLEEAASDIAGRETEMGYSWFENLVQQCKSLICEDEFRTKLVPGVMAGAVEALASSAAIPPGLATPVVLYVVTKGVDKFCNGSEFS